ncbi:MAG: hypothetical protein ACK4QW_05570 [Alphaproteobacteria bacterium]
MRHIVKTKPVAILAAGAALLALAACGSSSRVENPHPCPELRIPDETAEITRFRPGGAIDLTDVAFQARISGTGMMCSAGAGNSTLVDIALEFEAARGPAATQPGLPIDYFVAVVGPDGAILNREAFSIEMRVPDRSSFDTRVDELRITIPVREGSTSADYRLFAGFQMTAEELSYNRMRR